jgi:hypothetical protein
MACLCIAGAVLTRQSFLWLVPVAAWFLLRSPARASRLVPGAALLALAVLPLAALVVEWGGLVPPTADAASCGLCTDRPGVGRDALTLRTVGFTVALLGAYGTFVFGPGLLRRARVLHTLPDRAAATPARPARGRGRLSRRVQIALAAGLGVLLLGISPLAYQPIVPGHAGDAGYIWKLSDRLPVVLGSSLAFWVLVPLGCVAALLLVRRAGLGSLPAVYLAAFLVAALPVRLVYQKYFDPFALLALALLARPPDLRAGWDYAGIALLCAAFVAYAISFAG